MWFKRSHRNRRHSRSHVLDVKLRTQQVRSARVKMVTWSLGLLFGTVLGLYLLYRVGDWALTQFIYENKAFAVQKIDIRSDGVIPAERIRRWSGVKNSDNLMALDLSRVRTNLQLVPLIHSVSVERVFPDTLKIRVTERAPLAQVYIAYQPKATGNGHEPALYTLDEGGFVMPPMEEIGQPNQTQFQEGLPILVGVNPLDVRPGRYVETGPILAALQLIQAFERSPMAGMVDLVQIDVSRPEVLVVTTHQQSKLTFGFSQLEEQLKRWRQVHDYGLGRGLTVSNLDLSVANNVPATWFEKGTPIPSKTKNTKTSRTSKKHV